MNSPAPRYFALIPAAGVGARMAADGPKQYLPIAGKPMLRHTIDAFLSSERISHTFVVVSSDDGQIDSVAPRDGVSVLRCGGATRMESIQNGLQAMAGTVREDDWILVHDAARPGLNGALIDKLVDEVGAHPVGGLLALPVVDTVKRAAGDTVATISRDGLWLAQTPQMFRFRLLRDALAAASDAAAITDDASAVEAMGHAPMLVEGHPRNLKVTLPRDIEIAAMYLAAP
ncbi:2-C-methyl-D-erythritol 4-phosphate cytidylyltransferase [Massilia sp. R2A-15]|uniref:2-C-methyl-D-erythritol 4-phosphate cytidylyltransferase n=1 Tax=Massilia sp. R2A-15 TaxID=3064278 RepID=UPI002733CDD3|nr:2-C-methyl-D-erythritol 4-phosphate cytidylyltransferase [Massilia sp. R2A-15]WLI87499.1 2-C-methyl-D-erythritol 4-phosphate cytidylyltransferase [Massilia sp. R2A-15]